MYLLNTELFDILDRQKCQYFTRQDLASSFHQIEMDEYDIESTRLLANALWSQ